ncbi:hypothetical protein QCN32_gp41 [Arthrobacter phage Niktson]|uniref:Uncharacterized protein n=1 Tax=Arthrobacter phage Niktson TaxID=2014347 RepID=A0A218M5L0_9CAUD|nr:hypothetical protein QCN32_gp41 [Arthrobacter phage Niktson]ASD52266.1 hypothetical protein NIKTSON_41 [Arthrobacter phage Niktson]ASD52359.1 hypothetical protein ELEPHANTMAN_41 [Arthrobacter phage ElephantMan]
MSELNIKTNTCEKCGLTSTDHRIFKLDGYASDGVTYMRVVCYSEGACKYRQEQHPELMCNLETTTPCQLCGFMSEDYRVFVSGYAHEWICADSEACRRRKKRNDILAQMKEMAKKPHLHPVDKFSRAAVLTCGIFMGAVSAFGLSYLLFGV